MPPCGAPAHARAASAAARVPRRLGFLEAETPVFRPARGRARVPGAPRAAGAGSAYALPQPPQQQAAAHGGGVEGTSRWRAATATSWAAPTASPSSRRWTSRRLSWGPTTSCASSRPHARHVGGAGGEHTRRRGAPSGGWRTRRRCSRTAPTSPIGPGVEVADVTDVFASAAGAPTMGRCSGPAPRRSGRARRELPRRWRARRPPGAVWAFAAVARRRRLRPRSRARRTAWRWRRSPWALTGRCGRGGVEGGEVERAAAAGGRARSRAAGPAARRALSRGRSSRGDALVLAVLPTRARPPPLRARARGAAGALRSAGHTLVPPERAGYEFVFVTDFPLFERAGDERGGEGGPGGGTGVSPAHHPFTAPAPGHEGALLAALRDADAEALLRVPSQAYDLVCNGVLGGARCASTTPACSVLCCAARWPRRGGAGGLSATCSLRCRTAAHHTPARRWDSTAQRRSSRGRGARRRPSATPSPPKSAAGNEPLTGAPAIASAEALAEYGVRTLGGGGADDAPGLEGARAHLFIILLESRRKRALSKPSSSEVTATTCRA